MAGWQRLNALVREECVQAAQEGRELAALEALQAEIEAAGDNEVLLAAIYEKLLALPMRPDFAFDEPNELEAIRALRTGQRFQRELTLSDDDLFDKMYGAWLGRCVGCALGKPVEGFMNAHNGLDSWQRQKRYLTAISPDEWPIRDYFPEHSPAQEQTGGVCSCAGECSGK